MLRDSDAQLTVVYPAIEPRGRVADRVRTWTEGQTLARDRYRVVVVATADGVAAPQERELKLLLGPRDELLRVPGTRDAGATASSGGVLEIVEHGRTALVVPPCNPVELAGAISRLLEAPSLRAMMGAAAAASARARLNRRTMVGALLAWCAEIHAAWAAPR